MTSESCCVTENFHNDNIIEQTICLIKKYKQFSSDRQILH